MRRFREGVDWKMLTVQPELAAELSRRVRSDSMGLRAVYYWPGFQLGEGEGAA